MYESYPVINGAESFTYEGSNGVGILLCHGFLGTPQSMKDLGTAFASKGYTVKAPRLAGHGTHGEDLKHCSFSDWFLCLEEAYSELSAQCGRVYVVGQSMGGTLTLDLASRHKAIDGILLINPAMSIPSFSTYNRNDCPMWIEEGRPDIKKNDVEEITYTRTPRFAYRQLLQYMEVVQKRLPAVSCPISCFQSRIDHVVPPANTDFILQRVGSKQKSKVVLEDSYHVASMDNDQETIIEHTHAFIQNHLHYALPKVDL
ncbi:UNVERIFIED_CONTAM: alpha/beta fold hydrolase [Halobacillus marinus]|uniref:alpha/beta hydrolase n=1 Tax=Bacillaceae TaxID=186817 RepID=UPI0002A5205C|nr:MULTISPECIES: alpha/beta fold hydrolase [Bacillaceae]ELK46579.1 monoacylglycerol lipase [Halobacillus sp. BAB-2008]QHT45491.1 alpha/beta fold hydrolase [Bacillus sp. SB49]